jgi:hypothetical protein
MMKAKMEETKKRNSEVLAVVIERRLAEFDE